MRQADLQRRIENARALDFGTLLNQCMQLFKLVWVQGLVTLLLNVVLAIPVILVVYVPLIMLGIIDAYQTNYDAQNPYAQPELSLLMVVVLIGVYIFFIVAASTISFGLRAAFYRICKMKDLGETGKEDYFFFFKKAYLLKTVKLALVFTGISILAALLCFLPIIYVIVPLSFMIITYSFNPDMSISEIVKTGFDLGNKKWVITFGLTLISSFLASTIGFLMCCIGIYVTTSFSYLPIYMIYKEVVGFEDSDATKRLESGLEF